MRAGAGAGIDIASGATHHFASARQRPADSIGQGVSVPRIGDLVAQSFDNPTDLLQDAIRWLIHAGGTTDLLCRAFGQGNHRHLQVVAGLVGNLA
ncbi:hypothetical protein D9M71_304830 [compost metagenome]